MFDCNQFRTLILTPVLSKLQVYSKQAEELLVFTCAAESSGGTFLLGNKNGTMGIYNLDAAKHTDIWINFIRDKNKLSTLLAMHFDCNRIPEPERLIHDLFYATAMTQISYLRSEEKLPEIDDVDGLWSYYKKYYNTASKVDVAQDKYHRFVNN